jgi:hypothetical protein
MKLGEKWGNVWGNSGVRRGKGGGNSGVRRGKGGGICGRTGGDNCAGKI